MNKLNTAKRVQVIAALVEGNSINSTVRMTGISKPTILKLIVELGAACAKFHDDKIRNVRAERVQIDEIWSFCYARKQNVPAEKRGQFGFGDTWTWTALDADSKLMISFLVGERDTGYATEFLQDVASRLCARIQLTTDGLRCYFQAVPEAFGNDIDYARLVKVYGKPAGSKRNPNVPDVCIGAIPTPAIGNPDPAHISTSYVERSNLTMRMGMRRFTRLTNGFSKKIENHICMTAIFFAFYNFCRVHMTTKKTPAVAAGLADRVWKIEDLISLLG